MTFTTNLAITTSNSIQLQSSSLAQITQSTNQLTRTTLVKKTTKSPFGISFSLIRSLQQIDVIN